MRTANRSFEPGETLAHVKALRPRQYTGNGEMHRAQRREVLLKRIMRGDHHTLNSCRSDEPLGCYAVMYRWVWGARGGGGDENNKSENELVP